MTDQVVAREDLRRVLILGAFGRVIRKVRWQRHEGAVEISTAAHIVLERRAGGAGNTGVNVASPGDVCRVAGRRGVDGVVERENVRTIRWIDHEPLHRVGAACSRGPRPQSVTESSQCQPDPHQAPAPAKTAMKHKDSSYAIPPALARRLPCGEMAPKRLIRLDFGL